MSVTRQPLYAPRGAVATSQPLAASAGLAVLRRGGNAVDAALATAIALTQVQPGSNDIGADLFALVWDGTQLHGLNASGRSPAALTLERARAGGVPALPGALGGDQARAELVMPSHGWLPVTVPGAPAGWRDLHQRFGSLPFADLFEDAIAWAAGGWPVSPRVAEGWAATVNRVRPRLTGPEFAEWAPRVPARRPRAPGRRTVPQPGRRPYPAPDRRLEGRGVLPRRDRPCRGPVRRADRRADHRGRSRGTRLHLGGADQCPVPRPRGLGDPAQRAGHRRAAGAEHPGRHGPGRRHPRRSGCTGSWRR